MKGRKFQPNYSNVAVAELLEAGIIQDWVTTNYDGLAQKSGCLQVRMSRYFTFTSYIKFSFIVGESAGT